MMNLNFTRRKFRYEGIGIQYLRHVHGQMSDQS